MASDHLRFTDWLAAQRGRPDEVGELSRIAILEDGAISLERSDLRRALREALVEFDGRSEAREAAL
jgi:hypothetical protein